MYRAQSPDAKIWRGKANSQDNKLPSLVCAETMAVTALGPSTLCSIFPLPGPLPAPLSRKWLFPQWPRGQGEALSQHPPCSASSQAFPGKLGTGRVSTRIWGRNPKCRAAPVPKSWGTGRPRVMTPSSRRTSQRGRDRKEIKEGGPGAAVALSPSLLSISIKFLFCCPLSQGGCEAMHTFRWNSAGNTTDLINHVLYKPPDNNARLKASRFRTRSILHRYLCFVNRFKISLETFIHYFVPHYA